MDGYIILPLRGFEPVACVRMICAQLISARMKFYCQLKAIIQTKIDISFFLNMILIYGGLLLKSFKNYNFSSFKFKGLNKLSPKIDAEDTTDGQADRRTPKLDWTPLGSSRI